MTRLMLTVAMVCLGAATAIPSPSSAQECADCDDCLGSEHANVNRPFAIYGNDDSLHGCLPYTCDHMQQHGSHKNDYPCQGTLAYLAVTNIDQLTPAEVRTILERFPQHVRVVAEGQWVHVLDCRGEKTIAAFPTVAA